MKFKTLCVCATLTLIFTAFSDDMLTPQYDQKTPQTMPDEKTMKKQPFIIVEGSWVGVEDNNTVIHIDNIGHFMMRDRTNAQIIEEQGNLKNVSTSNAINDLRFELYDEKNQPMKLSLMVRQIDDKTRHLILLNGSISTAFRPAKD